MSGTGGEKLARLTVPARADRLAVVRATLRAALEGTGLTGAAAEEVVLAVDEACQNVVRHGYGGAGNGSMTVTVWCDTADVVVEISDGAPSVDPAILEATEALPDEAPDPDTLRPGGLGLSLIRRLMDEVTLMPGADGTGNRLRLVRRIAREAETP